MIEIKGKYSTATVMAYKNISDIVKNIDETAEILKQIKPIYNFKASN